MISTYNLARRFQDIKEDYFHSLEVISGSEKTVNGYYTNKVEHYLQKIADRKHALLVRSGSQALHLALLVNDIGRGDEVIITPNEFNQIKMMHIMNMQDKELENG